MKSFNSLSFPPQDEVQRPDQPVLPDRGLLGPEAELGAGRQGPDGHLRGHPAGHLQHGRPGGLHRRQDQGPEGHHRAPHSLHQDPAEQVQRQYTRQLYSGIVK